MQANAKQALREALLRARLALSPEERAARSRAVASRAVQVEGFQRGRTVGLYAAIGAEVETRELAAQALAMGKRVAWPLVREGARSLDFALCGEADLVEGPLGTRQPPSSAPGVSLRDLDVVVVPGVAFDLAGRRLGRGRGCFDATLLSLRPGAVRIGLAFELQIVPEVPHEPHDAPVDTVVTESRTIRARRAPAAPSGPR